MAKPKLDILGKRFGKLTVVALAGSTGNGAKWFCSCDCGSNCVVSRSNLISSGVKSCGCLPNRQVMPNFKHHKNQLLNSCRTRALKRGRKFTLSFEQFVKLIESPCFYCELPSSNSIKLSKITYNYNGIDRVNNSKDYVKNNVVACCKFCNSLKMDVLTAEETKRVVKLLKYIRRTFVSPWKDSKRK